MDDQEIRQAVYMILTAVECYNDDPKGVGAVLDALGDQARHVVLTGSDEEKIRAVAQALAGERKEAIVIAMQKLSLTIEPLEIEEEIGGAAGAGGTPTVAVDARIVKLEAELDQTYEEIRKLREQKQTMARELTDAQKKITSLEKKLEKAGG